MRLADARYFREDQVSRMRGSPFHHINRIGDMPKARLWCGLHHVYFGRYGTNSALCSPTTPCLPTICCLKTVALSNDCRAQNGIFATSVRGKSMSTPVVFRPIDWFETDHPASIRSVAFCLMDRIHPGFGGWSEGFKYPRRFLGRGRDVSKMPVQVDISRYQGAAVARGGINDFQGSRLPVRTTSRARKQHFFTLRMIQ